MSRVIYTGQGNFLEHYGIKGMKWGVRRFQNYDGTRIGASAAGPSINKRIIKKGTKVSRVAMSKEDKTYANKKHVSLNAEDEKVWENYLGERYKDTYDVHIVEYETSKDLHVATAEEAGKIYAEKFLYDSKNSDIAINDLQTAYTRLINQGWKPSDDYFDRPDLMVSVNIAQQTETGNKFCDELLSSGYDAVEDSHGWNTAKDPIIILDPDKNLRRVSDRKY